MIAFDKGDLFYDAEAGQEELKNWLLQNLAIPMGERGVSIKFMLVEVENEKKKPGPVFNAMLRGEVMLYCCELSLVAIFEACLT